MQINQATEAGQKEFRKTRCINTGALVTQKTLYNTFSREYPYLSRVILQPHRMDEWAVPVKIEPEDDLEYLQQEVNLEIKFGTEIDIPIKSEFDKGLQCYQQQRGQQPLLPFPSIKEELDKSSERVCKEDDELYQQQGSGPLPLTFPPIKDEFNVSSFCEHEGRQ
uniref:Uncharacterized protein n=1 Tax=Timema poppense TaxID=170557 RepID=A0A7R9HA85_TIMPO|nr:unnamed protein product [Timema poppensis]